VNEEIRAKEVRVVDEEGKQVGILPLQRALEIARERGLDLIEVAPQTHPPVCRILDYGKFKYQQEKRRKKTQKKHSTGALKEIRLSYKIDEHDFMVKARSVRKFLDEGHRVKVSLRFRGREMMHRRLGEKVMERLIKETEDMGRVESSPRRSERSIELYLIPKRSNEERKRNA